MKYFLSLTFTLVIIILSTLTISSFNASKKIKQLNSLSYLNYLEHIRDLIIATQKTRGLTNYYLNGDVGAKMLIFDEQRQMKTSMSKIDDLQLPHHLKIDSMYKAVKGKIIHLNKVAFSQDSAQLFHEYSQQVDALIKLSDTITTLQFPRHNDMQFSINVLLPLSENIGKLRGLGSGIIARGSITQNELAAIKSFMLKINELFDKERTYLQSSNHLNNALEALEETNLTMIEDYLHTSNVYVIKPQRNGIKADSYFTQGTKNISGVILIYNEIQKHIRTSVEKKLKSYQIYSFLIWFIALILIMIQIWYFVMLSSYNEPRPTEIQL